MPLKSLIRATVCRDGPKPEGRFRPFRGSVSLGADPRLSNCRNALSPAWCAGPFGTDRHGRLKPRTAGYAPVKLRLSGRRQRLNPSARPFQAIFVNASHRTLHSAALPSPPAGLGMTFETTTRRSHARAGSG